MLRPRRARDVVRARCRGRRRLMEKYLEGETLTQEEIEGLLSRAIAKRLFVPVFVGSCIKEQGVNSLMDDIATYFPAPTDYGEMPLIDGDSLKISSEDDRPVVFVFKTLNDPSQGRISFIKCSRAQSSRAWNWSTRARVRASAWRISM